MNEQEQFRRWQAMDAAHFLHPFSDTKQIGERGTRLSGGTLRAESSPGASSPGGSEWPCRTTL